MTNEQLLQRLNELEIRQAHQDDLMTALDQQIADQEQEIRKLWEANRLLRRQLNDMLEGQDGGQTGNEPPPHY